MLVLSRAENERIFINGEEVIIKLLKIEQRRVLIGIQASSEYVIEREELHFKKKVKTKKRLAA